MRHREMKERTCILNCLVFSLALPFEQPRETLHDVSMSCTCLLSPSLIASASV